MTKSGIAMIVSVLVALLIATAFLASWEIPAPSARVNKVLPDDRFQR